MAKMASQMGAGGRPIATPRLETQGRATASAECLGGGIIAKALKVNAAAAV